MHTLFIPDAVHPAQLIRRRQLTPEQRLCVAVLEDAIEVLRKYGAPTQHGACVKGDTAARTMTRQLVEETRAWVRGAEAPLSVALCCEQIGADPDAVRERLCRAS